MSVSCALALLARSLTYNLVVSDETLGEVGITQSINSFEVEMSNWVSVFFVYLESQRLHIERCIEKHDGLGNNSGTAADPSLSPSRFITARPPRLSNSTANQWKALLREYSTLSSGRSIRASLFQGVKTISFSRLPTSGSDLRITINCWLA